jgi:hypothetical protein
MCDELIDTCLTSDDATDELILWLAGYTIDVPVLVASALDCSTSARSDLARYSVAVRVFESIDEQMRLLQSFSTMQRSVVRDANPPAAVVSATAPKSIPELPAAYETEFPSLKTSSSTKDRTAGGGAKVSATQPARRITPTAVVGAAKSTSHAQTAFRNAQFEAQYVSTHDAARSLRQNLPPTFKHEHVPPVGRKPPLLGASPSSAATADVTRALPTTDSTTVTEEESALLERLARLASRLLTHGMAPSVFDALRTLVLLLRADSPCMLHTPLPATAAVPWRRCLLGGGARGAQLAASALLHAKRLLLSLDASTQRALAASVLLRERAPTLASALAASASARDEQRVRATPALARSTPPSLRLGGTLRPRGVGDGGVAGEHLRVDDANRHRFRERSEQAVYNNRERQRDEFFALQRAWFNATDALTRLRAATEVDDSADEAHMRSAVQVWSVVV